MKLMLARQLFVFATASDARSPNGAVVPAAGTNNEAERALRTPAQARDMGRTNKTTHGARRRTIIVSVLESLRLYLSKYTLKDVIAEIERWRLAGRSCFEELLASMNLECSKPAPPNKGILDQVLPVPDG